MTKMVHCNKTCQPTQNVGSNGYDFMTFVMSTVLRDIAMLATYNDSYWVDYVT